MRKSKLRSARVMGLGPGLAMLGFVLGACNIAQAPDELQNSSLSNAATKYAIQELERLPGCNSPSVDAVNADGSVLVGTASCGGEERPVKWNSSGEIAELELLAGPEALPLSVSADGSVIVGTADNSLGERQAVKWNSFGEITALEPLSESNSIAFGVSADGSVIAGYALTSDGQQRAVIWNDLGELTELEKLDGEYSRVGSVGSRAVISADGSVIVGYATDTGSRSIAVKWNHLGELTELGEIGSSAHEISTDGRVIVGTSGGSTVKWNTAGEITLLESLGTAFENYFQDLSADGSVIVGVAEACDNFGSCSESRPVKWDGSGEITELSTLGGRFSYADDVSADGSVIAGRAENSEGETQAVIWNSAGEIAELPTLAGATSSAALISADSSVIVGSIDSGAGERVPVIWVRQETATPESYTITFDALPLNKVIYETSLGQGIVSDTGSSRDKVYIQAKRQGLRGNVAVVTGQNRELIISKNGRSGASFPRGGVMDFQFSAFGDGRVNLKSITVSGTTNSRGSVSVYRSGKRLAWLELPKTGDASRRITFNTNRADQLIVRLKGPGSVDTILFRD